MRAVKSVNHNFSFCKVNMEKIVKYVVLLKIIISKATTSPGRQRSFHSNISTIFEP